MSRTKARFVADVSKPLQALGTKVSKSGVAPRPTSKSTPMKAVPKGVPKVEEVEEEVEELEGEELEGEEDEASPEPKVRRRPTMQNHLDNYDNLFKFLDEEIDTRSREREKGVRSFRKIRKILTRMRKEVPYVTKSKSARLQSSSKKKTNSGLMMECNISHELATFLKVKPNVQLSRVDVTRAICAYAHLKEDEKRDQILKWKHLNPGGKRNLQLQQDKKAIAPDKALAKLLRYDQYIKDVAAGKIMTKHKDKETGKITKNKVTSNLLYYYTIQQLLTIHFLEATPKKVDDEAEAEEAEEEDEEAEEEDEEEDEEAEAGEEDEEEED